MGISVKRSLHWFCAGLGDSGRRHEGQPGNRNSRARLCFGNKASTEMGSGQGRAALECMNVGNRKGQENQRHDPKQNRLGQDQTRLFVDVPSPSAFCFSCGGLDHAASWVHHPCVQIELDYSDGGAAVKPKIMRTISTGDYAPILMCQSNGRLPPVHNPCMCIIFAPPGKLACQARSGWRVGLVPEGVAPSG